MTIQLLQALGTLSALSSQADALLAHIGELRRQTAALETQIGGQAAAPARYAIRPTSILAPIVSQGSKLPVYCVHPIDGGVLIYAEIAKQLGVGRPFVALLPVGTFPDEPPLESVGAMARRYRREIEQQQPDGPYNIMGWSFGGLVAFEMACRWREDGIEANLCMIDTVAPVLWRHHLETGGMRDVLSEVQRVVQLDDTRFLEDCLRPSAYETVDRVFTAVEQHAHFTEQKQPLKRAWAIVKANTLAALNYQPSCYPSRLVFIQARDSDFAVDRGPDYCLGWQGAATYVFHREAPGDHRGVMRGANVAVVADHIRPFLIDAPRQTAAAGYSRIEADEMLAAFAHTWRSNPYARTGAWHMHDLIWLGRLTDGGTPPRLLFPEVREKILALQHADGSFVVPSVHPYCNFIVGLTLANTLILWDKAGYADRIRLTLDHALRAYRKMSEPLYSGLELPYGKYFYCPGLFGRWAMAPYECTLLFAHEELLTPEQRQAWRFYADYARQHPRTFDYDEIFSGDYSITHIGESFPDDVLLSDRAKQFVDDINMPGCNVAYTSKYYQLTRDERALRHLDRLRARLGEGLRPGGLLQEAAFSLRYLMKGGVDVRRHFQPELDYIIANMYEDGAPLEQYSTDRDTDGTALIQAIANQLGIRTKMPTPHLDVWWNADTMSYQSLEKGWTFTTPTVILMLEAYLYDDRVPFQQKRDIWRRTLRALEKHKWRDMIHQLSPIYTWEIVIGCFFKHAHRFPDDPTDLHHVVLEKLLQLQQPDGGFQTCYIDEPDVEQTSIALIGLKTVLSCAIEDDLRQRVRAAAERAQAFMMRQRQAGYDPLTFKDFWFAKLLFAPINVIEAGIVASLYSPIP